MSLTPKQKAFLEFISDFQTKYGFAPSQTEIARHFGYRSLGTVQNYLFRLKSQGLLDSVPHSRRGLALTQSNSDPSPNFSLPLLGRVSAGKPIEAIANQEQIEVPSSLVRQGEHFVLRVVGNSMIEDGILHGDYIVVRKQKSAESGQTVVALIDDSATVKRFYPKKNMIELHPANPEFKPIVVRPSQSFQIQGIVAGVIRRLD